MEDLKPVFLSLKSLLVQYQPPFVSRADDETHFDLWSKKDVVIAGRKRREVFFAGVIIQKIYVGFYFMPIYGDPSLKTVFQPELLALLKGKSCFHIRTLDDKLRAQVRSALKVGYGLYRKQGWA